ncbi:hypothetical protein DPMN_027758 [Dreissena polymorpha]|uniref:BEACH domain-containing protein n=1 Tax=Dreissena polymorpha TaxID=45954 RepID=A0A9D4LVX4_DREPO|nr:hypothetical protein DPMN_027758 [Dreissena polymorpha]
MIYCDAYSVTFHHLLQTVEQDTSPSAFEKFAPDCTPETPSRDARQTLHTCRYGKEGMTGLPITPTAAVNARLFTFIHRQALESDHVSENIASWLDLIFGAKQRGEEAVRAINVFHPACSPNNAYVKNELDRKAIQTMVQTYGQTPKQLFLTKHPLKKANINRIETQKSGLELPHLKQTFTSHVDWGQTADSCLGSALTAVCCTGRGRRNIVVSENI